MLGGAITGTGRVSAEGRSQPGTGSTLGKGKTRYGIRCGCRRERARPA